MPKTIDIDGVEYEEVPACKATGCDICKDCCFYSIKKEYCEAPEWVKDRCFLDVTFYKMLEETK